VLRWVWGFATFPSLEQAVETKGAFFISNFFFMLLTDRFVQERFVWVLHCDGSELTYNETVFGI